MSSHNPRRSSIRIGSTSVIFNDASESSSTDPPTIQPQNLNSSSRTDQSGTEQPLTTGTEESNASPPSGNTVTPPSLASSSSQIPQLGTEPFSVGEKSDTSSQLQNQSTTQFTDVYVVLISLPIPPPMWTSFSFPRIRGRGLRTPFRSRRLQYFG
ncbi:hypothetical protein P9112_005722 [Eukaryota sp. TZLM1-RC]